MESDGNLSLDAKSIATYVVGARNGVSKSIFG